MAGPKHSEIELDQLTEEERAGLMDDELVDEGLEQDDDADEDNGDDGEDAKGEADADDDNDDDDGQNKADADADADDGAADKQAEKDAAAAEPDAAAAEDVQGDDENGDDDSGEAELLAAAQQKAPWVLPDDHKSKIEAIDKQLDDLHAKFDDGELTGAELRAQVKPLQDDLDQLKSQALRASITQDQALANYRTSVGKFLAANNIQSDTILHSALDAEVRRMQAEIGGKGGNTLDPRIVEVAHKKVTAQLARELGLKTGEKDAGKDQKPKAPDKKAKRDVPPTLSNIPSADITDANDDGEFGYLDRLANSDVLRYEKEFAKLSPEAQERYLAAS
jgi:hypothetical protein